MYLKVRVNNMNSRAAKTFCDYYNGLQADNAEERKQFEADARADAPEWGVSGVRLSWVESATMLETNR
jgi:hypothetical protein